MAVRRWPGAGRSFARLPRACAILAAAGMLVAGCSAGSGSGKVPAVPRTPAAHPGAAATGAEDGGRARATSPLAGKVIGIDPGHNGENGANASYINQLVWNGRERETCDTTGTETAGGYTEAQFNLSVATYLRADLRRNGARVVMTRDSNGGAGPCVTRRAQILNHAHPDAAIDIHADGGPSWGHGFTVLEPVADGPNNKIIRSSEQFGADVRSELLRHTRMPESNYYGHDGLIFRDDLAGLNLATEPKVLIECGNMPNATDARLLTAPWFQRQLARTFTDAIIMFLRDR
jgi:N-acetylmuramoyl-L-alanine amidase